MKKTIMALLIISCLVYSNILGFNTTLAMVGNEEDEVIYTTFVNSTGSALWTYMVYLNGDYYKPKPNDIIWMLPGINIMELSGSTSDVNIVVQADDYNVWGGETRRYYITHDEDPNNINSLLADPDTSEKNMGDPQTLTDFIEWSTDNFPAEHYILIMLGHAAGWGGICYDITSGDPYENNTHIDINELEYAISSSGVCLDILFLWACQCGQIEVYYQLKNYVDIILASEVGVSFCNDTFEEPLKQLTTTPTLSTTELSQIIVDSYFFQSIKGKDFSNFQTLNDNYSYNKILTSNYQCYLQNDDEQCLLNYELDGAKTLFGIYMDDIDRLTEAVNALAESMLNASNYWETEIVVIMAFLASRFNAIFDLYEFADYISNSNLELPVINVAKNITSLIDSFSIIKSENAPNKLHGIRIHPLAVKDPFAPFSRYKNIAFAKNTKWDEFLSEFYYALSFDGNNFSFENVQCNIFIEKESILTSPDQMRNNIK